MRSGRRKSAVIGGRRRRASRKMIGGVPKPIQKARANEIAKKKEADAVRPPGLFGPAALASQPMPSFMPASMRPNNR